MIVFSITQNINNSSGEIEKSTKINDCKSLVKMIKTEKA